ncbi:MAG: alpha/beta fold hydrolase [Acidobacteriota bacterium]
MTSITPQSDVDPGTNGDGRLIQLDIDGAHSSLAVRFATPENGTMDDATSDLAVLYSHGFASSQGGEKAGFFRRRFLDLGLAFCSFDFQGHGASGGGMRDLTLSRNLDDIACVQSFLETRGYRRFVLFGSSMGGGTALWHATRRPETAVACILIAPAVDFGGGLRRRLGPEGLDKWRDDGVLVWPHELGVQEIGWDLMADLDIYPLQRLADVYRSPGLIFQGTNDDSVDYRDVIRFVDSCDESALHLHLMTDGDHRLIDRLDLLWSLTESFLDYRGLLSGAMD